MKIIALDGVDGCGKSYLADKLVNHLSSLGLNVIKAKFPDNNYLTGKNIYDLLFTEDKINLGEYNPFATWMLYAVNRHEWFINHKKETHNAIIVCDRYVSSIAFQIYTLISKIYSFENKNKFLEDFSFDNDLFSILTFNKTFNIDCIYSDATKTNNFLSDLFGYDDSALLCSFSKAIDFMMFFEYNILKTPVPDIEIVIKAHKSYINKNLSNKDKDMFEKDPNISLREKIYDYMAKKFNYITIFNRFSEDGTEELKDIFSYLRIHPEFEFINYINNNAI